MCHTAYLVTYCDFFYFVGIKFQELMTTDMFVDI